MKDAADKRRCGMRKLLTLGLSVALCAAVANAGNGLGGFGAYWAPDGDGTDSGFGGGVKLLLPLAPEVSLEIRGSYFPDLGDEEGGVDADLMVVPAEVAGNVVFPLEEDVLSLYAGGGVGYYFVDGELESGGVELDVDPDDEFGFFVQGGGKLMLSEETALFAEAVYRWVEIDEADVEGVGTVSDIDLELTGFGANAGLMLLW